MAKILFFTRGTSLLREVDPAVPALYQIVKGRIAISKSKGTDMVEIDVYGPGAFLGELTILESERPGINAEALDDTEILAFDIDKDWLGPWNQTPGLIQDVVRDLTSKLKRSYDKVKRLQYFERITYDHLKAGTLRTYHLKDILRLSRLLALVAFRYGFQNGKFDRFDRELFEDQAFQVLPRTSVRLIDFVEVMRKENFIRLLDESRFIEVVNIDWIEGLASYLGRCLRKNDPSIYLKPMDVRGLKHLLSARHNQLIGQNVGLVFEGMYDEMGKETAMSFAETDAIEFLTREMEDDIAARAALQQLINKKVISRKNPEHRNDPFLVLNYSTGAEIAKYQEVINDFARLV